MAEIIIGRPLSKPARDRLRRRGEWPRNFYIGRKSFVLTADIDVFLVQRVAAAPAMRAELSEKSRGKLATRWLEHNAAKAAEAA